MQKEHYPSKILIDNALCIYLIKSFERYFIPPKQINKQANFALSTLVKSFTKIRTNFLPKSS